MTSSTAHERKGALARGTARAGLAAMRLLLLFAAHACNGLTGVNDLVIESEQSQGESRAAGGGPSSEGGSADAGLGGAGSGLEGQGGLGLAGDVGMGGAAGAAGAGGTSGGPDAGGVCDLVSGVGCGISQTCAFDQTALVPVCRALSAAPVAPYARCASDADCGALQSCLGNVCNEHCNVAGDCGWQGALCLGVYEDEAWSFCTRNCDPISLGAPRPGLQPCGAGARCLVLESFAYTDCVGDDDSPAVADGGTCQTDLDCAVGSICIDFNGLTECRPACDVNAPACSGGALCQSLGSVAGVEVGYCEARICDPVTPTRDDALFGPCAAGEYCLPGVAAGVASCLPATGVSGPNVPCTDHTNCNGGLSCFNGVCRAWCRPTPGCGASLASSTCQLTVFSVPTNQPVTFQAAGGDPVGICGICNDTCGFVDGFCDDGGPNSDFVVCDLGTDCTDCGIR